ncbi:hypothetical protein JCM19238_1699 [Vibrio ponticus]|nr:hypothetical protein JCM19238_1699 [Vibrio ponticus]
MKVVVVEKHKSEYPEPFYLKQGELVTLGEMDDEFPNWIFVTTQSGEKGWAPVQYIDIQNHVALGVLNQDYDNNEFNTELGERLTVLFELNAWYRVSRVNNELGWVPVNTVSAELNQQG